MNTIIDKILALTFTILFLTLFGVIDAKASLGTLDPTFGMGGKVITDILDNDYPQKMAVQPDGKIIIQGLSGDNNFLIRYNPNGSLDSGFGTNGKVIIPRNSPSYELFTKGLAITSDGKILVSGVDNNPAAGNSLAFAVFRFNNNGSRDLSFGSNGVAVWSLTTESFREDYAITLKSQPDGKIVVGGYLSNNCNSDPLCFTQGFAFIRLNTDGSLDTSFGTNGAFVIPHSESGFIDDFVILPNGKILMIGSVFVSFNSTVVYLRRINTNGTQDTSFGTNGVVRPEINEAVDIYQLAIQSDGKIVFPVHNNRVSPTYTTIVRLNADGSFDRSFGVNGKIVIQNSEGFFYKSTSIQSNGKILAGGLALTNGTLPYRFAVLRLNTDGSRDTTFGSNGIITTLVASYGGEIQDMALQPDGKLIVCGGVDSNDPNSTLDIGLARYLLDTPRPTPFDFDGDGRSDVSVFRPSDRVWYLNQSTNGFFATQFGLSTDKLTPADYDGDGKTDISVYRDGIWYWLNSSNNSFNAIQFGLAGDIPVPADYTGDGRAEIAIYRKGVWWSLDLTNYQVSANQFGISTDIHVVADYDGDGRADQAIYRNGEWHLNRSSQGYTVFKFGLSSDKPVPADYDGDGTTDMAVYRNGTWWILQSSNGFAVFQWGIATDKPAPADYDGDGKADAAVYRNGTWWILQSTKGVAVEQFGLDGDVPLPSAYML